MKTTPRIPLPLLGGVPAGSALAEDLLGHYVEQWLAMDQRMLPAAEETPRRAPLQAASATANGAVRGVRQSAIVPNTGDIIPDAGQWKLGQ